MCFPELAVIHVLDPQPGFGLAATLVPVRTQMAIVKTEHLRSQPRWNVHSVGDMPNGDVVFEFVTE